MTGRRELRGLPRDDVERLARWTALVRARNRQVARLRQASAEAVRALAGGADPAEVVRLLHQQTQLPWREPDNGDE